MGSLHYELCEKCPYLAFFWSVFSHIRTEYGDLFCKFLFSVRMRENTDQKNSEYGYTLRSDSNILLWENIFITNQFLGFYIKDTLKDYFC